MVNVLKLKIFLWQVVAIIGLNCAYVFVISNKFRYMGFQYDFSFFKLFFGCSFILILLLIGLRINNDFVSGVYNVILLYLFCGEIIYYQYNPGSSLIQPVLISICLLFVFLISKVNVQLKLKRKVKSPTKILTSLSVVMFIPFVVYYYKYIDLKNLLLIDVYKTRQVFRGINNQLTGYLSAPLVRILLPMLIVDSIEKRKKIKVLLFFAMILFVYLCGALKSVFFGLLALIVFYKGNFERKSLFFAKMISFLTIFGIFIALIFDNVFLLDSFIRRVFFVPPYLNNIYINFFSGNHTYLSHSPLGMNLIEYPYDRPLSMYVGEVVIGSIGLNANVGLITEGFVSFGFFGGVFAAVLISLIVLFLKMINFDPKYFGILFVYIYYFNTSFLSVLLATHGLIFFVIFSYYFFRSASSSNEKNNQSLLKKENLVGS